MRQGLKTKRILASTYNAGAAKKVKLGRTTQDAVRGCTNNTLGNLERIFMPKFK